MAVNVRTLPNEKVDVDIVGDSSAFGDVRVSEITPLCGWTFAYGLNPAIVRTTISGTATVTASESHAVLSTGATADSVARMETIKTNRYIPGIGGVCRFTAPFHGPTETGYQMVGLFDDQNGWGFGYNSGQFGIFRRRGGVTNWVYKADWNGDKFPAFDPTKGIPFEISFQWLGYGAQMFKAATPEGNIITLHTIRYSNSVSDVSVLNPNLPLAAEVSNGSAGGDVILRTPSGMAGLEGYAYSEANSVVLADDVAEKAITAATEYPVISFFDPTTNNGVNNRLFVQALRLVVAADGNKNVTFRAWAGSANPVNGTFAAINSAISAVQSNKDCTTFNPAGQVKVGVYPTGKIDSQNISLSDSRFFGYPGQYITITAISSNTSSVSAGISFRQFL
jgi:hypothetical protein